jgi:hypothetical protein
MLVQDQARIDQLYRAAEILVAKLHTFRKTVAPEQKWLREDRSAYDESSDA